MQPDNDGSSEKKSSWVQVAKYSQLAVIFPAATFVGWMIAYLNFHWLERVVTALADRVMQAGRPQSSKGVVLRFLLRYVLMGLAAYAILSVSPTSLYGLFAGLFLPVAAIGCEAAYEAYVAVARGL